MLELNPDAVMLRATWMFDREHGYIANLRNTESPVIAPQVYRGVTWIKEVADNIRSAFTLPGGAYNFGSENALPMP